MARRGLRMRRLWVRSSTQFSIANLATTYTDLMWTNSRALQENETVSEPPLSFLQMKKIVSSLPFSFRIDLLSNNCSLFLASLPEKTHIILCQIHEVVLYGRCA